MFTASVLSTRLLTMILARRCKAQPASLYLLRYSHVRESWQLSITLSNPLCLDFAYFSLAHKEDSLQSKAQSHNIDLQAATCSETFVVVWKGDKVSSRCRMLRTRSAVGSYWA